MLGDLLDGLPPHRTAVHLGDETIEACALRARASAVAELLDGVAPGAPIAVRLPNSIELIATLFGVWKAGAVYLPVNPRLTAIEVERVLGEVRPAAVIGDGEWPTTLADPARHDADIALIQFTSGTTGPPKPVPLRHSGVLALLEGVIATLRTRPPSDAEPMPNLVPVSLSLWAGIYQVLFAYRIGAPVVIMDRFEPTTFAALVRRHSIRSTVLPPAAMTMLADEPAVESLAPLEYVRSITAPLSPLQARRFRDRFGVAVLNGYGQTEIGGEIIGWSAMDTKTFGDSKLGATGRPHAGVHVRTDAHGELQVRTPATSAGYASAELTDRVTEDGWFRTGDLARIDDDGFVWIDGRVSDMINRGGLKVFPEEVAEVLRLSPAVADAAVAGAPDERLGEVPWAFVVPAAGPDEIDVNELDALCRAHLAPYKVPARIEIVDALPRNEIGKVTIAALIPPTH
jgi:acyl-CoA synthetase (AMP-forming)/AMP-acid ligase II